MNLRDELIDGLTEPEVIYSRHEAQAELGEYLFDDEAIIYGLEKRDSLLKVYRTRWYLTETKFITVTTNLRLNRTVNVFVFADIRNARIFEDENVLVLDTVRKPYKFKLDSPREERLAEQLIEQYERVTRAVEERNSDDADDDTEETADNSSEETSADEETKDTAE